MYNVVYSTPYYYII